MKKIIWVFFVFACVLNSCDKYEQQCKKLYGAYTLKTYTVDGIDSLYTYKTILGDSFYFHYFEEEAFHNLRIDGYRNDGQWGGDIDCRWQLMNEYKILNIYAAYGLSGIGPFGEGKILDWEIISTKNDQIKMKCIYNGKEYYVELN